MLVRADRHRGDAERDDESKGDSLHGLPLLTCNRNTTEHRNDDNGFRVARTFRGPSRLPHGDTGCAMERVQGRS